MTLWSGHCCVCSGVCWHVGGPHYCPTHRPSWPNPYTAGPAYPDVPMVPVPPPTQQIRCEHCYCLTEGNPCGLRPVAPGHRGCCNCHHQTRVSV